MPAVTCVVDDDVKLAIYDPGDDSTGFAGGIGGGTCDGVPVAGVVADAAICDGADALIFIS